MLCPSRILSQTTRFDFFGVTTELDHSAVKLSLDLFFVPFECFVVDQFWEVVFVSHSPTASSADGASVSSIFEYSLTSPVLAVWNR